MDQDGIAPMDEENMPPVRIWAPAALEVVLVSASRRWPLTPATGGWWTSGPLPLVPGDRYAISIDGGPPRPDPRALRLPDGVHGSAALVDQAAFLWTDHGWQPPELADAIIYELHVGTYSPDGTFDGAIGHLDHLVDLGISHVELMPVHAFPGHHGWGYDPAGLFAVHEPYGGPDALKRFVDTCHRRGLAVLLDVIYNHMGPEGNYLGEFGPYVTDRFQTPWGGAVNLGDRGADEVRRFIVDNATAWIRDYHVDGLRIDAVHALVDLTATHLMEQLATEVKALDAELGRRSVLIAESDLNDPRFLWDRDRGGYGLDAQWSDDFHHALHVTLTGERDGYYEDFDGFADLVTALERTWVYDGRYSAHRGRRHGRPPVDLQPGRFLGYSQTHDQVGNRAAGDRLSQLVDPAALHVAAALVLCAPFVPMLFQGEEWGASSPFLFFADYTDEALQVAVREGRRREFAAFGWSPETIPDPTSPETLERSRLDWTEVGTEPHRGLLAWYQQLIGLRRLVPGLRDGLTPQVRSDVDAGWLVLDRVGVSIAVNTSREPRVVPLSPGNLVMLAASSDTLELAPGVTVTLPPMSVAILGSG